MDPRVWEFIEKYHNQIIFVLIGVVFVITFVTIGNGMAINDLRKEIQEIRSGK